MDSVTLKIPGKVMLAGEYSVLRGTPALAFSVELFMWVRLSQNCDHVSISSAALTPQKWVGTKPQLASMNHPLFDTVRWAMDKYGFETLACEIESEIKITYGMGSSSALRLGIGFGAAALAGGWKDEPLIAQSDLGWKIATDVWHLQQSAQKKASGYDFATQLLGGVIEFVPNSLTLGQTKRLQNANELLSCIDVFVGGEGAPTSEVMSGTLNWLEEKGIVDSFDRCSTELISSLKKFRGEKDLADLIIKVRSQRQLLELSPSFPKRILDLLGRIPGFDKSWTFKTTGAGGEDAFLVVGTHHDRQRVREVLLEAGWIYFPQKFNNSGTQFVNQIEGSDVFGNR